MRRGERQVPIGSLAAGIGALIVIASLFLHWYDDLSGFTVFEVLDLVLLGLAIASLASAAEGVGFRLPGREPLSPSIGPAQRDWSSGLVPPACSATSFADCSVERSAWLQC